MCPHRLRVTFSPLPRRPEGGRNGCWERRGHEPLCSRHRRAIFSSAPSRGKQRVPVQALVVEAAVERFKVRVIKSGSARSGESPGGSCTGPPKKGLNRSPNRFNNHFQNTNRICVAYPDHRILRGGSRVNALKSGQLFFQAIRLLGHQKSPPTEHG